MSLEEYPSFYKQTYKGIQILAVETNTVQGLPTVR